MSESPLNCKEIQPVNPKGNQSWIFIGKTGAEAEAPIIWPPDAKNWFIRKDPDAGKDWRQEKKGTTEDEMVGWYHWLYGPEFDQALGVGDGQGSLDAAVQGITNSWTWLSEWTELNECPQPQGWPPQCCSGPVEATLHALSPNLSVSTRSFYLFSRFFGCLKIYEVKTIARLESHASCFSSVYLLFFAL